MYLYKSSSCSFDVLKDLGIYRPRGKRSGRLSSHRSSSPCPSNSFLSASINNSRTDSGLHVCLLNCRSINNKSCVVNDFVTENDVDIFAITETWLTNSPDSDYSSRTFVPWVIRLFMYLALIVVAVVLVSYFEVT